MKKKSTKGLPRPQTIARAFAKHGYSIKTISNHYDMPEWHVEVLLAKYINKLSGWQKK